MKKIIYLFIFLSSTVNAALIDFESLASSGTDFATAGNTYTEAGFKLTDLSSSNNLLSAEANNAFNYAGSTALFNSTLNGITELVNISNATFDLFSIDLTEIDINRLGPTSVAFTGNVFGGGTVNQTFSLDSIFGFETFLFAGFNDLTSVTWTQTRSFHQFDNIQINNISSVPVPAAVWLFGSGLIGLVGMRKKQK